MQPENVFQPEITITAESTLTSWSMAKSITHAAVGLLVADGAARCRPLRLPSPSGRGRPKAEITLLHLLEMRSGLRFVEDYVDDGVSHCLEMLFGDSGPSHAAYAAALPLDHAPGSFYNYSSGTTNIIARIVGDIVTGRSTVRPAPIPSSAERRSSAFLQRPAVRSDRDDSRPSRSSTTPVTSSVRRTCIATARDFARFGELYRLDGVTPDGRRILPEGWSDHARGFSALDPENGCEYGRHWWMWPEIPGVPRVSRSRGSVHRRRAGP